MVKWVTTLVYAVDTGHQPLRNVVREGSMCLNYPELVHKHTAHLASPLKMYLDKMQDEQSTCALVWGSSSPSNLLNPS